MYNFEFKEEDVETLHKQIGQKVQKLRKEKGITQMQLALAIGHNSVGHIAKAELSKYNKHFNIEQLYKISKILDVKLHHFFIFEE